MTIHIISGTDSLDELFSKMAEAEQKANETSTFKGSDFNPGDCFVREDTEVPIYGVVVDDSLSEEPPEDPEERAEWEEEQADMKAENEDSKARGYIFGRCFSQWCPSGELGSTHTSRITKKITRAEFEQAKVRGWE
jgi:hypothetical protein